ncbi:MAG TPA: hypothetical protein DEA08_23775 [Planctomycetes bacterium]|nr:hypothetical protein [Planctomycetota bacterium]|tara:strand:+ start:654 stop:1463 length:810 start_codon:yes stop_codon:yes gene_type:complete
MRSGGVLAVASLAFRESARSRVLHALIGTMVVVCGSSYLFAWVAGGDRDLPRRLKIVGDFSLSALTMLGTLAAIFLGTNLVYQEVQRRTVYPVLSRPLSRSGFVLGKYLGLVGVLGVAVALMSFSFLVLYALGGGRPSPQLLAALGFVYVELLVVTAIAILFSVAAHPIEGAVFSFVVAVAGHQTSSIKDLADGLVERGEAGTLTLIGHKLLWVLYLVFPNLENFNLRGPAIYGMPLQAGHLLWAIVYAAVYTAIVLALACLVFRRKTL